MLNYCWSISIWIVTFAKYGRWHKSLRILDKIRWDCSSKCKFRYQLNNCEETVMNSILRQTIRQLLCQTFRGIFSWLPCYNGWIFACNVRHCFRFSVNISFISKIWPKLFSIFFFWFLVLSGNRHTHTGTNVTMIQIHAQTS